MAVYEYVAKDDKGARFSGVYTDVESVKLIKEDLGKMGDTLINVRRKKTLVREYRNIYKKIKRSEIVAFTYELAGMCSAGMSIVKCIETIEGQIENPAFKYVLSDIRENIETGSTLKGAFEKHKEVFSEFFVGMLEAGETGGKLSETLRMSADYLEKQAEIMRKVKSAFAYPLLVGTLCIIVVVSLMFFVIPVFSKLYQQLRVQLPAPTQILLNISTLAREWWWAGLPVIAVCYFLIRQVLKTPYLRAKWDVFKLHMPVFGKLNRMVVVSNFIRTFAMMVSAGISLIRALEIAGVVANNAKISEITKELERSIETGNPVAASLKNYDIFPSTIVQLAASGEEAGVLSEMLNKGVDLLDRDIDRIIKGLLLKIEPIMTLIMGAIVGLILAAVYLPMFDYLSHLK
jgi:type IV pilus assembly protein PilC